MACFVPRCELHGRRTDDGLHAHILTGKGLRRDVSKILDIAFFLAFCLLLPCLCQAQRASSTSSSVEIAPKSSTAVQADVIDVENETALPEAQKLALLQSKIKYVFVLFEENRSFDFYFGTYPGAHGLYSQPPEQTPGFRQKIVNTDGSVSTITPFRIPVSIRSATGATVQLYPQDTDSVNHGHTAYQQKIDLQPNGVTLNDQYALTEERLTLSSVGVPSRMPSLEQKQMGELVMGHVDCDTAPILWNYADRGVLFDDFHQTVLAASTPNAIALIAGQTGETQWVKHSQESTKAFGGENGNGVPVVGDGNPFWGSQLDIYGSGQPAEAVSASPEINLTFASLPLSFMGSAIETTVTQDREPQIDLTDIEKDIKEIAGDGVKPTSWGWYQQGYDHEGNDPTSVATHAGYIAHHNAPQYFGYVSNNPAVTPHLHGLTDFFSDIAARKLPEGGGVFYVRGGYNNIQGLHPVDPDPKLRTIFSGNDDHPGYSDVQISDALLAEEIDAIAASPYWSQSAILITYDETDGLYDHAPEAVRSYDSFGVPLDQGPRIPTILLSPYGVVHGVSHEAAEHSSIIKFIDLLYGLKPLADLPDEAQARAAGLTKFHQPYLGPADDHVPGVGNLFSAFDNNRLLGTVPPVPASFVTIPPSIYSALPQYNNRGCSALGITPTDHGLTNPIPPDFNPRPAEEPNQQPLQTGIS